MNRAMEQLTQAQHKAAEALYKQAGAGAVRRRRGAPGGAGAAGAAGSAAGGGARAT